MTIATSTMFKFASSKAENEALVLSAVAVACKALAKGQSTLKFMEQEIICSTNNVHDLSLKSTGEQAVFTLKFQASKGVCVLNVRPCNPVFHPEQKGMFWVKFQAPKQEAKLLGIFDGKGKKVAECVKYVPQQEALPFDGDMGESV